MLSYFSSSFLETWHNAVKLDDENSGNNQLVEEFHSIFEHVERSKFIDHTVILNFNLFDDKGRWIMSWSVRKYEVTRVNSLDTFSALSCYARYMPYFRTNVWESKMCTHVIYFALTDSINNCLINAFIYNDIYKIQSELLMKQFNLTLV